MINKRIIAALSFFTRFPFWRLTQLSKEDYARVVPYWPAAGLVTGGCMSVVFLLSSLCLPLSVSIVLTIASRIIVTGALHEDGLADFCDGFGGGTSRKRTLEIMKDSHTGTFGILGLGLYLLLMWNLMLSLAVRVNPYQMCLLIILLDVMSKCVSSTIIDALPYARTESEAKSQLVYANERKNYLALVLSCLTVSFPLLFLLFRWMRKRIGGYTGDCCGATFLIVETYYYLLLLCLLSL